jgi:hypothetical protein
MSALISDCDALKSLIAWVLSPDVSLPRQNVTSPVAPSIDAGSMTLAPSVTPVSSVAASPPPPPPPPSSSSPQAPTKAAQASTAHSMYRNLFDTSSPS